MKAKTTLATVKDGNKGTKKVTPVTKPVPAVEIPEKLVEKQVPPSGELYKSGAVYQLPLDKILPDPNNPKGRCTMDIDGLTQSIKAVGVLQPIIVQPLDGGFVIVAGERRYHAARIAGLKEIPAMLTDGNSALVALIENLQRLDLTSIQEAESVHRLQLSDVKKYTATTIASLIGKSANRINEILTLAKLPLSVREKYRDRTECNSTMLCVSRRGYETQLKDAGKSVDKTSDAYATGLIEYIDNQLNSGKTANQLRSSETAARKAAATPNPEPPQPPSPGNESDVKDRDWPDSVPPKSTDKANTSPSPQGVVKIDLDPNLTESLKAAGTPPDAVVTAVKNLHGAISCKVGGLIDPNAKRLVYEQFLPEDSRQTVVGLLTEILHLLEPPVEPAVPTADAGIVSE